MIKKLLLLNVLFVHVFACAAQDFDSRVKFIEKALDVKEIGCQKSQDVDVSLIAKLLSPDDNIQFFASRVAFHALKGGGSIIKMRHLYQAYYDMHYGSENSRGVFNSNSTEIAYHEVGHAMLTAKFLRNIAVDKVTVLQRGNMEGGCYFLHASIGDIDTSEEKFEAIENLIAMLLAGGIAEDFVNKVDILEARDHENYEGLLKLFLKPGLGGNASIMPYLHQNTSVKEAFSLVEKYTKLQGADSGLNESLDLFKAQRCAALYDSYKNQLKFKGACLLGLSIGAATGLLVPSAVVAGGAVLVGMLDDTNKEKAVVAGYNKAKAVLFAHQDKVHTLAKELDENTFLPGQRVYDVVGVERPKWVLENQ